MSAGRTEGLTKTFVAEATINPYRILKFGISDNGVVQAAAATDGSIGIAKVPQGQRQRALQTGPTPPSLSLVTAVAGDRVDVVMNGIAEVTFGGTVTRGALLTSDANGKAIAASTGNRVIGVATCSGVVDDIGTVLLAQG